ncbi:MAG: NDP-sugar synthase [Candidatus Margulisiibacteriota bacterium]|jgi:mannose-1-phosphate guanylyltransferase/phosphomannomutase
MQAVILAGGKGVKLRPLTFTIPKSLLILINKPIIDYLIYFLKEQGVTNIIIAVDYLAEEIINYINSNQYGISIRIETVKHFNGTAQILKKFIPILEEEFIVLTSDILFDLPINKIVEFFKSQNTKLGLIARKEKDLLGKGGFIINNNKLVKIVQKDEDLNHALADSWLYYFKKEVLSFIPNEIYFDIHLDLIKAVIEKFEPTVYYSDFFWAVLGRIDPYLRSNFWILNHVISKNYVGTTCKISPTATLIEPYFIDEACEIGDNAVIGPNVILNKGVIVKDRVKLEYSIIYEGSIIYEETRARFSVIAHNSVIRKRVKLGFFTIVGENTVIKDGVTLNDGARIGPNIVLEENTILNDFLFPEELLIENVDFFKHKNLDNKEKSVYLVLAKSGEQSLNGLVSKTRLNEKELLLVLNSLLYKKLIITYNEEPKMYALVIDN